MNGPIRSIRGAEGGTEDLLVCLSDFHIFIVLIPKLGSTLKKERRQIRLSDWPRAEPITGEISEANDE